MGEGAATVRAVVRRMIEPRGAAVVVLVSVVVTVVIVAVVEEDDRAVDVNVIVAVVQRVQPRQNGQRGAEGAEHKTCRRSPATHRRPI